MLKYETLIGWGFNVLEPENLNCQLPKLGNVWISVSKETREKISLFHKGRTTTEETKLKMSEAAKKRGFTKEHREKLNKAKVGKKHTEEHKLKISMANKGRVFSQEVLEKYKRVSKLRKVSDKTREASFKARSIAIIQMDLDGNFIKEWFNISIASRELKISRTTINGCCCNNIVNKTAGGFKWKYKLQKDEL
jgi:hypothetical protein